IFMTAKEFEVQKALGLAGEYDLAINTGPSGSVQAIKDAVVKHSFTSKCFEVVYSDIDEPCVPYVTLKFEVGCVHEIMELIKVELHPHSICAHIAPRNFSRLLIWKSVNT
ncbi:hypothetical protein LCGC14_3009690, partial [marine sediment metagenome]